MKQTNLYFTLAILYLTSFNCKNDKIETEKGTTASTIKGNTNFKSGYSDVNGLKMYYEIYGTGKPLVLIHGGGSTIQTSFGRILPALAKNRQVIAVELQAHGHTVDRNRALTFEQDADDVATLLQNLNITKADFFGFSNGGNTTMQIAIRHPDLANKIIVGSAFYKRSGVYPQFWDFMRQATIDQMPGEYKEAYAKVAPNPRDLQILHDKCLNRMLQFKDWSDNQIKSITAPALLIIGDADMVLPEHAVEMYRLIPHCRLAVIPGGHGKYIGEITTLSNANQETNFIVPMIEEFLDETNKSEKK